MTIQRAVFLRMCSMHGNHGHVELADGSRSQEFASCEVALQVILALQEKGRISSVERDFLLSELMHYNLAVLTQGVSKEAQILCSLINERRNEIQPRPVPRTIGGTTIH